MLSVPKGHSFKFLGAQRNVCIGPARDARAVDKGEDCTCTNPSMCLKLMGSQHPEEGLMNPRSPCSFLIQNLSLSFLLVSVIGSSEPTSVGLLL